jgi:hypothetical protein
LKCELYNAHVEDAEHEMLKECSCWDLMVITIAHTLYSMSNIIQHDQNKMEPKFFKHMQETKPQYNLSLGYDKTVSGFYSVTKLKKTNISYFLTLIFQNFPT